MRCIKAPLNIRSLNSCCHPILCIKCSQVCSDVRIPTNCKKKLVGDLGESRCPLRRTPTHLAIQSASSGSLFPSPSHPPCLVSAHTKTVAAAIPLWPPHSSCRTSTAPCRCLVFRRRSPMDPAATQVSSATCRRIHEGHCPVSGELGQNHLT
jgi:hypothetical protein